MSPGSVEIEMVQAVALRKRPSQTVRGDRSAREQNTLWRGAFVARSFDRKVDTLAWSQAHFHDHIGQEARRRTPATRLRSTPGGQLGRLGPARVGLQPSVWVA